jgi:hypothetical protein
MRGLEEIRPERGLGFVTGLGVPKLFRAAHARSQILVARAFG